MRRTHYSPALSRQVVSALYHSARSKGIPMTKLADQLLRERLEGTEAWRMATAARVMEEPTPSDTGMNTG
jgi:hypothetical protein